MKKSLLSILAVLFGMTTPMMAQSLSDDYVPLVKEGAKWECDFATIFNDIRPNWYTPYSIEIKGDTIINDIAYKCCVYTFEESSWSWEEYSNYSPGETITLAFIREDVENRKVYVLFNNSKQHAVYNRFFQYTEADGEFLLYDFANINNPEQMWQKKYRFDVSADKITIDGVERNCYAILGEPDIKGYIIEGIGYDGYGFFKNAGDFICQYPTLVAGTDEVPIFKAYKNVEGKIVYTTGDAANGFNGVERIDIDENAPILYYNLQGVKVDNPHCGVFIKVQGEKATKEFVK